MDISQLEDIGKAVGAIVAILGIVKVFPYMKKIGLFIKDCCLAPFRINQLINELKPNGGASLRDSINRIELNQCLLSQKLAYSLDVEGGGFFYTDIKGEYIEASLGYCRLTGKSERESLGKQWIYNIHPKDRIRVVKEWIEAIENQASFESQYSMINYDDEEMVIDCHASPLKNMPGQVVGYFGLIKRIP